MTRRALLVTGSRLLADDPAAESWARGVIASALDVAHVIAGGARGPDAWATELALARGVRVTEYRLDGQRWRHWGDGWVCLGTWTSPAARSTAWPLRRNAAMVEACVVAREQGWSVSVLALYHAASPTHGTGHTARAASAAGLEVRREVWR